MSSVSKMLMQKFYRKAEGRPEKLPWHSEEPGRVLVDAVRARGGRGRAARTLRERGAARTQTFVSGSITETSAGVATVDCRTQLFDTYCWFPEVRGARTNDVHESLNADAFFYWNISPEGDTKSGRPPAFLGLPTTPGGMATYDNNVFGNNFQGPHLVHGERDQWEFTSRDALGGFSTRIYPLIYGQKCITVPQNASGTSTPPDGGWKNSKIREDDECWDATTTSVLDALRRRSLIAPSLL